MGLKEKLGDLVVFGGPPAFNKKLHVGQPNIGNRQRLMERLNDILDRKWLTNDGPYLREFEQKIAEFVGAKHCIAICNATVGLGIVTQALGLSGEVILPSMTFIATAHALLWHKLTPVFCDIDPQTWNIDPLRIEELITPKTSAIIGVHLFGRPCDVDLLVKIAHKHNLKLLYDAAHAFGCSVNGQMIGNFGIAEIFSFHATKFVNSLEGGAVTTNDDELATRIRLMRNFGFADYDNVVCIGTNGKMNEFQAAKGLTSLESLKQVIETNHRNYKLYQSELEGLAGVTLMDYPEGEQNNYQFVVLEIDQETTQISRDTMVKVLWAENVLARRYFYPGCHRMEPYRSSYPDARIHLNNSEAIAKRLLSLPTGLNVDKQEISKLCSIIRFCISHGVEISRRFSMR